MSSRIPVHCELIDVCLGLRQRVIAEALQRYAILLQEALGVLPFSEDPAQFIHLPRVCHNQKAGEVVLVCLDAFLCIICENCCAKIGPQSASLSTRV